MKELGGTSVGALGISLGGSSVLNASDQEDTATALDGGILAVSPPAIPKLAWERLSEPVPRGHPRYPIHRAFEAALISRDPLRPLAAGGRGHAAGDGVVSAPYYEVDAEEIWTRSRGIDHVADAKVPLLVLHPEDDQIVKVEHARMLQEAANGNDLVRVWILPRRVPRPARGRRSALDPRGLPRPSSSAGRPMPSAPSPQANGGSPELVYSSQEPG